MHYDMQFLKINQLTISFDVVGKKKPQQTTTLSETNMNLLISKEATTSASAFLGEIFKVQQTWKQTYI